MYAQQNKTKQNRTKLRIKPCINPSHSLLFRVCVCVCVCVCKSTQVYGWVCEDAGEDACVDVRMCTGVWRTTLSFLRCGLCFPLSSLTCLLSLPSLHLSLPTRLFCSGASPLPTSHSFIWSPFLLWLSSLATLSPCLYLQKVLINNTESFSQ